MIDTGFGVSFKIIKDTEDTEDIITVIDNNLPNSKWDRRRQVL